MASTPGVPGDLRGFFCLVCSPPLFFALFARLPAGIPHDGILGVRRRPARLSDCSFGAVGAARAQNYSPGAAGGPRGVFPFFFSFSPRVPFSAGPLTALTLGPWAWGREAHLVRGTCLVVRCSAGFSTPGFLIFVGGVVCSLPPPGSLISRKVPSRASAAAHHSLHCRVMKPFYIILYYILL